MKKYIMGLIMALITTLGLAGPAIAHTSTFSATCDGVVLHAESYDGGSENIWSVTINGVTESGTFGSSFDQTFKVKQNGKTSFWSAYIEAEDGTYHFADSGTVGPCGKPPVEPKKKADFNIERNCDTVKVSFRKNVDRIVHRKPTATKHVFIGYAEKGAVFPNGKRVLKKVGYERTRCNHTGS